MLRVLPLFSALLFVTSSAAQEPLDKDKLAYCLVANSSSADTLVMRQLLIAALQDDVPEMKSRMADFVAIMLKISMGSCGVGLDQMNHPDFGLAAEKYGEMIGAKIMQEAMAKIQ